MSIMIDGLIETEIYRSDDGFIAIGQPNGIVIWLTADQLLDVIRELQTCYDERESWREPTPQ